MTAFSYGLLLALAIALLVAAFTDLRRRQIDNGLNIAIALGAPLFWWANGFSIIDVAWQLGLCAVTFCITALLFALRQMGGGDVKLLAAVALWITPLDFLRLIMVMALIGGAMSVAIGAANMTKSASGSAEDDGAVRYARATAAIWALFSAYVLFVLSGGTPVRLPGSPWLGLILLLVLIGFLATGVRKIVRRQAGKVKVPYGLAISAAGIWLLIGNFLTAESAGSPLG